MIQAIIFDMDGLLIDSEPMWRKAEKASFEKLGIPVKEESFSETMGVRVDVLVEYWFERFPWEGPSKKEVENDIISTVIALFRKKGSLMPGAIEIMKKFRELSIPMAIASSSPTDLISAVLKKTSISKYISVVHSAESERFGKPHPDVYMGAAKKLGICARRCLAFEDSPNGVLSAKAAGMKCIAVPSKEVRRDKAIMKADLILDSLLDFDEKFIMDFNKGIKK